MNITIDHVIEAARAGGNVLRQYFGTSLEIIEKSMASDMKTRADMESEQVIRGVLERYYPEVNFQLEETGVHDKGSEYTFVVDPLDGTHNFVTGIPNFTISIALLKGKEIVAGVIYVPVIDQMYWAETGGGAFHNGKAIRVGSESVMNRSTIAYTQGYAETRDFWVALQGNLYLDQKVARLLLTWAPTYDYCLLASGKIEAMINNHNELHDYAAGKLIAWEAGALLTDFTGNPQNVVVGDQFLLCNGEKMRDQIVEGIRIAELQ